MPPALYRFGAFELDVPRLELRHAGRRVPLQPKALDLLIHLVRHRDRVVPKDELLDVLWPDVVVTEASLSKAVYAARRALGSDEEASAIRTLRGRGFRFAAPVEPVLEDSADEAPAAGRAAARAAAFVGRRDVLASLAASVANAERGRGKLVLLTGEAGMGKTRTAQEVVSRAAASGVRVLHGWCHESEGAPGLWPWRVVLRQLWAQRGDAALLASLGEGARDLAGLVPELREQLTSDAGRHGALDPAGARFRRFETVVDLLVQAARGAPHLLVLDDFHRADADSLELLRFLVRAIADEPLVVLVAHRSETLPVGHPLLEIAREPLAETLALDGLDRAEVAELLHAELGRLVPDDVAEAIRERTGGNPFFARELGRVLAASGRLQVPGAADGAPLPATIRSVLHERLERLSPACRELLQRAALLGRELDVALLARASECDPARALARLDEARAEHVVREDGGAFRFTHGLLRDELLAPLAATQRARCHRSIAEALKDLYGDDLDPHLGRLAHHFCAGAAAGCATQAVHYARLAGERAAALGAHGEAAEHYRRALAAEQLTSEQSGATRCDLLLALGEAHIAGGDPAEGRRALERAADLARRAKDPERLARAALAAGGLELSSQVGVDDPGLIALLEEAFAELPERASELRVRLRTRLGEALYWSAAWERSEEAIEGSVEAARALRDPLALGYALYGRHWLTFVGPAPGPHLEDADEMLALAHQAGHRELALAAHSCRFLVLLQLGRGSEARVELGRYQALAHQLRVPRYRWRGHCYDAALAALEGRFADVASAIERTAAEEAVFHPGDAVAAMMRFFLDREQDRAPDTDVSDLAARLPAFTPTWRSGLAMLLADTGRHDEAREAVATLVTRDFVEVPRSFNRLTELVMCSEACATVGDAQLAERLHAQLLRYRPRLIVVGGGFYCLGSVELYLGRLAATAGDAERARTHLAAALDEHERSGARPWSAWTRYELARLPGAPPADAAGLRRQAVESAHALGMVRLARLAAADVGPSG
ncbi:MAG: ATP-binding protein [Myxococcota bacterium]